jgi:uncharacterized membrane protein
VSLAAFEATMTPAQRHLAHRLESFGDVVFGFTISQLALQFTLPVRPEDLVAHASNYFVYAVTFTIIAMLWLSYHRTLSTAYVPTPVDIALTFVFLAFTGLTPYAMYAYIHFMNSLDGARYGLAAYLICGLGTLGSSTAVRARNYLRGSAFFDAADRLKAYRRLLITGAILPVFALVLVLDIVQGVTSATVWFFVLPVAVVLIRRLVRTAPLLGPTAPVTEATT